MFTGLESDLPVMAGLLDPARAAGALVVYGALRIVAPWMGQCRHGVARFRPFPLSDTAGGLSAGAPVSRCMPWQSIPEMSISWPIT